MKASLDAALPGRARSMSASTSRKGIGVIGLHEGRTLLLALGRTTHAHAVAGCDLDRAKCDAVKAELPGLFTTTQYRDMLSRPDVDIVAIYTPDPLHGRHIVEAFDAGKDVICTKPLVNSMDDARMVLAAARRSGRGLFVGQSTRFFEPFIRQREAFERGEFGELELVDAHYVHRMDWYYEKSPWVSAETDWVFLGLSHPIDLVRWYLGRITEVHAYRDLSSLGKLHGVKSGDIYLVNLRTAGGRIARAMGHYGLRELPGARNCIELFLCGTRSSSLAQYHDMRYLHTAPDGTEVCEDSLYELRHFHFNSEIHGMHYGEFANYTEYFAAALLDSRPWSPNLEEGIETFCVMEAVRRSAVQGVPVAVEPLFKEAGLV